MVNKKFEKETAYQVTMILFRQLLKQGVINNEEYNVIDTKILLTECLSEVLFTKG